MALVLFAVALTLFTWNHHLPASFHPDEPSKVKQIERGRYRFTHPMLLIKTAEALRPVCQVLHDEPPALMAGRWASALFAAGAVVLLALMARRLAGPLAGWSVGALAICPPLLTYAHYFKEDTALVFGFGAVFLALANHERRPSPAALAGLGAACALAISGKALGLVALVLAAPAVASAIRRRPATAPWWRPVAWFGAPLLTVLFVINYDMVSHLSRSTRVIASEIDHVTSDHYGLRMRRWGTFYLKAFAGSIALPVGLLAGGWMIDAAIRWRRLGRTERLLTLFPPVYFVILSLSPVQMHRYLLPALVATQVLAGLMIGRLYAMIRQKSGRRAALLTGLILLGVTLTGQGARCADYLGQFKNDSRLALRRWIGANLPPGSLVLEDAYTALSEEKKDPEGTPLNQLTIYPLAGSTRRLVKPDHVSRLGHLSALRELGVTHVAVSQFQYDRFLDPNTQAAPGEEAALAADRAFYTELFTQGQLVWRCRPAHPMRAYTNPELRVYRIQ